VNVRDLHLLHWRGQHVAGALAPQVAGGDVFLIDTCQRRVALFACRAACGAAEHAIPADGVLDRYEGHEAYAFLLRFACGLESKLVAETEVFGQLKQAWREFEGRGSLLARALAPVIQQLFQDAKAVRSEHLSALGSASYGSQLRRLLGEEAAAGPVLLLGAGQLAQAVAPWIEAPELWLWNRTAGRAAELAREVEKRRPGRPVRVLDDAAELAAWHSAHHVILCVPPEDARDAQRVQAWQARRGERGRIVHLGLSQTQEHSAWLAVPELVSLGALFDMLHTQTEQRRRQVERARRACAEKALLRVLGASATQPHGWEDLAAFECL
jgi:glutamyl-tRNA reductase